jgi:N-dimethylarginine dimethylaminohydrolase
MAKNSTFGASAYGGKGWSPRSRSLRQEIGDLWAACGLDSEWAPLRGVLLHRPGDELAASAKDANAVQMLAAVDVAAAQAEHDAMADALRAHGVAVHYIAPEGTVTPNQMFCADLLFMTPEGLILGRPASTLRAGEERQVARAVAALGMPILKGLSGTAVFEGADAMWLDSETVIIGHGLRTNLEAIEQVATALDEIGVDALAVDMPYGTMHLMGMLRFADRDLAIAWPRRTPHGAVLALREHGYEVAFLPEADDDAMNRAMNFVTLGPRKILMNGGCGEIQSFFEGLGIDCVTVEARELIKAAGGFGCLTGVLHRDPA